MFVKWECGCVGIKTDDPKAEASRILKACDESADRSAGSLSWLARDQSGKRCRLLQAAEIAELHQQIARRFAMADRFEDVQRALGIEAQP